jgi:prolyl-tRNA synthetase
MAQQLKNESITARRRFREVVHRCLQESRIDGLCSVKGFIDYLPYGYAIWEEIQNYLNKRFKEKGAQNVYLPMVIPTSLFNKEKEHIEGFAPECLVATYRRGRETRRSFGHPSDFGDSFLRYV